MNKELQFRTVSLAYDKFVTEKRTYVNKLCHFLNPYLLTVLLSIPLINYLEPHADHSNNPSMPTNAPMPSSQPQQPIQQVHVPAHVYFHR